MQKRELVLLVDETEAVVVEAIDPLLQRNAINVRLTAKKNLVLTTTKDFSADFLLQHTDT
jgi:predicted amidohydrolase YtcJ